MIQKILTYIILFFPIPTYTTVVVRGNDTEKPFGFKTAVTTKVLDRKTGIFYVGITNGPRAENKSSDTFAVSKSNRPDFRSTQTFTGIAQDDLIDKTIEFLDLLPQSQAPSLLAVVIKNLPEKATQNITILPTDGKAPVKSNSLNDSRGINNLTRGIVNIAATSTHVFAAIRPSDGDFGTANGGIALLAVNRKSDGTVEVTTKNAQTGADGNQAIALQNDSAEITATEVTFADGDDQNQVAMHFDEKLDLVYMGLRITTDNNQNAIGKAVVIARLNPPDNKVVLQSITSNNVIDPNTDEIIVAEGQNKNLRIKNVKVLHASTGPSYLVVNGGVGETNEISNKIFALPLVNNQDPDPANASHGTLADKNSDLIGGKFVIPAFVIGNLPNKDDVAAKVGGSDLPIQAQTPPAVTDMVVVGDTVYVSVGIEPDVNNDTGIFYSQALFGANGKIIRWTPWSKRAVPLNAFVGTNLPDGEDGIAHNGPIKLFDVDAATGNMWVVEDTTGRVVGITSWTNKSTENRLITKLNEQLDDGCFAILDLDQVTRGFLVHTEHRYALFGSVNKVVFARISQAQNANETNSPQTIIADFSNPQNFRITQLPENAGCVSVLEYRKSNPIIIVDQLNFFFAGTQHGLFVFSKPDGVGFTAAILDTLDAAPFADGIWQKAPNITSSVIDIKTSGNSLYVLTQETTRTQPFKSTLFNIEFQENVNAMFANNNIRTIAETNVGIFENVTAFFGIQIIATGREDPIIDEVDLTETREQLILATSNGLYKSNANQQRIGQAINQGIADAQTQDEAAWQLISGTANTTFIGIGGMEVPVRHTVWPLSMQDEKRFNTFERSSIHQVSGSENLEGQPQRADQPLIGSFNPTQFNAQDPTRFDAQDNNTFVTLDPITHFWSDGGRRFFIFNRVVDAANENKLGVLPFDAAAFNLSSATILTHPILQKIKRFYWIKVIGASGLVLAGTEQGVVGLE